MSPFDVHSHSPEDGRFVLLVDGVVSVADRRELLASLDDVPNGWRRCALAFLEAQTAEAGSGDTDNMDDAPPSSSSSSSSAAASDEVAEHRQVLRTVCDRCDEAAPSRGDIWKEAKRQYFFAFILLLLQPL